MKEIGIGIFTIIVLFTLCVIGKGISVYNTNVLLVNQIQAKQQANEVYLIICGRK